MRQAINLLAQPKKSLRDFLTVARKSIPDRRRSPDAWQQILPTTPCHLWQTLLSIMKVSSTTAAQRCEMTQVIIHPGEDGYWVAECPSLPGCVSQGRSKEEAVANVREAILAYVAALEEDDLPVPEERFETLVVAV